MHELSIAFNIIDLVKENASRILAKKVNHIQIEVGKLAGVDITSLIFALDTAKKGTIISESTTEIIEININAICLNCDYHYNPQNNINGCPNCKSSRFEIITGKELKVKSFDVD